MSVFFLLAFILILLLNFAILFSLLLRGRNALNSREGPKDQKPEPGCCHRKDNQYVMKFDGLSVAEHRRVEVKD